MNNRNTSFSRIGVLFPSLLTFTFALGAQVATPGLTHAALPEGITFDGIPLGSSYLERFGTLPAYASPCEIDPINDQKRSVIFYTAKPCKGKTFAESTTVVMFTSPSFSENSPNPSVTAIAWMGGTYFETRSNFPAKIGMTEEQVRQALGQTLESQNVRSRDGRILVLQKHAENAHSMILAGKAVGFALGELPSIDLESEENEEWSAIAAGYFQFTPAQPQNGTPSTPTQPGESVDPRAQDLLNRFFEALLISDDEEARFASLVPTLHRSLLTRDKSDFAPGIRDYAYRRACREVSFFQNPVKVVRVKKGTPTAIGVGPEKEIGRVDKYYVEAKQEHQSTISPAPLHVFFPQDGSAPTVSNFGSL